MTAIYDGADRFPTAGQADGVFGCEVQPRGPLQDMPASIDLIAGAVHDRSAAPDGFTGGSGGRGLGGRAVEPAPAKRALP